MKTLLFSLLLTISGLTTLEAQINENPILNLENEDKKRLNWGYYLGFNQYDFKVDYKYHDYSTWYMADQMLTSKSLGFNVGLIGELRLNDYLDVRLEPGLYYNQRDVGFKNLLDNSSKIVPVKSTYIHIPLLLKVSTKRLGNIKPYVVGGVATSFNLSSNNGNTQNITNGVLSMRKSNYYWEVGFGIDFYLRYFKFSPSIRGSFAFQDEITLDKAGDDPFLGNVKATYSRAIFVNFTFE
ncbi:porin family protein [Galbibacter sp.]|uniref:type IX secretion/gliding motility protein PorT/SprT n=1 Tax=Galbibacter sp. TaxID=2918471 RepID=UPI002BEF6316|nr:porin family protein [Galbibacter sp.]HLV63920.1 porin family protein [Galbibacter sp.]